MTSPAPGSGVSASVTTFGYNNLGELTSISDPLQHVTKMTYTPAGLIQRSCPEFFAHLLRHRAWWCSAPPGGAESFCGVIHAASIASARRFLSS